MMHQLFTPLNLFLIGILLLVVGFGTFGVIAGKKDHPSQPFMISMIIVYIAMAAFAVLLTSTLLILGKQKK